MLKLTLIKSANLALAGIILTGCAVSAETRAKMDEYARTIPTCANAAACQPKWNMARAWVETNGDFGIRSATEERIVSTTNISSDSGVGITVTREPAANGEFFITIDMQCLVAYGCPQIWDMMIDFNRTVNAAN